MSGRELMAAKSECVYIPSSLSPDIVAIQMAYPRVVLLSLSFTTLLLNIRQKNLWFYCLCEYVGDNIVVLLSVVPERQRDITGVL